jgi:hypothetical protein
VIHRNLKAQFVYVEPERTVLVAHVDDDKVQGKIWILVEAEKVTIKAEGYRGIAHRARL